jgi:hypothetical protein
VNIPELVPEPTFGSHEWADIAAATMGSAPISPFEALARKELERDVAHVVASLTEDEQFVIEHRFGLGLTSDHSMDEVGELRTPAVCRERIRQIEAKALRKLRHESRSKVLEGYVGPRSYPEPRPCCAGCSGSPHSDQITMELKHLRWYRYAYVHWHRTRLFRVMPDMALVWAMHLAGQTVVCKAGKVGFTDPDAVEAGRAIWAKCEDERDPHRTKKRLSFAVVIDAGRNLLGVEGLTRDCQNCGAINQILSLLESRTDVLLDEFKRSFARCLYRCSCGYTTFKVRQEVLRSRPPFKSTHGRN